MSAARIPSAKNRVLLVDDQALFREGLLRLFSRRRAWQVAAGTYAEAVALARRFAADVAVLGFSKEEIRGLQTFKFLRRKFPQLPVLLLDEVVRTQNVQAVLAAGAQGYWTKEISFWQLLQVLQDLRLGKNSFCPEIQDGVCCSRRGWIYHPPHAPPSIHALTRREAELLVLLARGGTLRQCAQRMGISVNTVDNHKSRMMRKLGVHKTVDLARLAIQEGLLIDDG